MNKDDYNKKMIDLLSTNTYCKINRNPLNKINNLLKNSIQNSSLYDTTKKTPLT